MNTKKDILTASRFWNRYGNFDARSDAAQQFLADNGLKLVPENDVNAELSIASALVDFEGGDGSRGAWDRYPRPVFNYIVAIEDYEEKKEALEEEHYNEKLANEQKVSAKVVEGKRGYFIDITSAAVYDSYRMTQKKVKFWEEKTGLQKEELAAHLVSKIERVYAAYGQISIERKKSLPQGEAQ